MTKQIENRKSNIANRKTGTREWSEASVNCCLGCAHGCLYCYARHAALHPRYGGPGMIADGSEWVHERPAGWDETRETSGDWTAARKYHRKYAGTVMFPTQHDITPGNSRECRVVLACLLTAGNRVLVVSKASREGALDVLTNWVTRYRERVEVRVTIGGLDERLREFWEPGAPPFAERIAVLKDLHAAGIPTSVSCEPLLDPPAARQLAAWVGPFCSGDIWIGMANKLRQRTDWLRDSRVITPPGLLDALDREIERLEAGQTPEKIREVYEALKGDPKIRWKDSYADALRKQGIEVGNRG